MPARQVILGVSIARRAARPARPAPASHRRSGLTRNGAGWTTSAGRPSATARVRAARVLRSSPDLTGARDRSARGSELAAARAELHALAQSVLSGLFVGGALRPCSASGSACPGASSASSTSPTSRCAFLGAYLTVHALDGLRPRSLLEPRAGAARLLRARRPRVRLLRRPRSESPSSVSLLVTFGLTVMIESLIQWVWTADYRRLETAYGDGSRGGWGRLSCPKAELLAAG